MMHDGYIQAGLLCLILGGFGVALLALFGDELLDWLDRRDERADVLEWRARMREQRTTPLGDALLAATIGLHRRPAPYDQDAA